MPKRLPALMLDGHAGQLKGDTVMRIELKRNVAVVALLAAAWPAAAAAQATAADLMAMGTSSLRGEIESRYDAALALTTNAAIVSADNPRFLWASQAKAQCGIALGFLKSGTKDPVSIGKCVDAANRMNALPPVVQPPAPPAPLPDSCSQPIAGIVFFDFDVDTPPESSVQTLDAVAQNMKLCKWTGLSVSGHTDRAGSDGYNDALSLRRATAVQSLLVSKGVPSGQVEVSSYGEKTPKVPTVDGERNPTNRRVEILVK